MDRSCWFASWEPVTSTLWTPSCLEGGYRTNGFQGKDISVIPLRSDFPATSCYLCSSTSQPCSMAAASGMSNCITTCEPLLSSAVISTVCARSIFSSEPLGKDAEVLSADGVQSSFSSLASFKRYSTETLGKKEIPWISSGSTQSIFRGSPTTKVPRANLDLCDRL